MEPQYQELTYEFQPNQLHEIHVRGDFLTCLDTTGEFTVAFGSMPMTRFQKGLVFETQHEFHSFKLRNVSNTVIKITVGVGVGGIRDNRLVLSGAVQTSEVAADIMNEVAPVVAVANATTLIAAANSARKEIILTNLSITERIWLKGTPATIAAGQPRDGGQGVVLSTTAAIYAYNPNGVDVQVSVVELEVGA